MNNRRRTVQGVQEVLLVVNFFHSNLQDDVALAEATLVTRKMFGRLLDNNSWAWVFLKLNANHGNGSFHGLVGLFVSISRLNEDMESLNFFRWLFSRETQVQTLEMLALPPSIGLA